MNTMQWQPNMYDTVYLQSCPFLPRKLNRRLIFGIFLILSARTAYTEGVTVNLSAQGETSVPFEDINVTVTSLDLSHNDIAEISWFQPYSSLETLSFTNNCLTTFPVLSNISTSLRYLDLAQNKIFNVTEGSLENLNLTHLYLGGNGMVTFPDMEAPWGSQLSILGLANNSLSTVPRVPALKPTAVIQMENNSITCNCKLRYTNWCNTESAICKKDDSRYGKQVDGSDVQSVMTSVKQSHKGTVVIH